MPLLAIIHGITLPRFCRRYSSPKCKNFAYLRALERSRAAHPIAEAWMPQRPAKPAREGRFRGVGCAGREARACKKQGQ